MSPNGGGAAGEGLRPAAAGGSSPLPLTGRIDTVYTDRRPVELRLWLSIQNRFHPLFAADGGVDQATWSKASTEEEAAYRVHRFRSLPSNDLLHVVAELEQQGMLPAIYFIFSRRGCREALQRCAYHSLDHGIIAKEADVEIGTIYEVAMGEGLVIESKFLPNYNMVLNLLRIHPATEAEKLMQRSFGQYQKQLAASQTRERLVNVRERLRDLERVWECDQGCRIEDLAEYYRIEDRRRVIRIEIGRAHV